MIDLAAAQELARMNSDDLAANPALRQLLDSIDDEHGDVYPYADDLDGIPPDVIARHAAPPTSIAGWQVVVHEYAKAKGWWDGEADISGKIMLMAAEVHEGYDEWRNNHPLTETYYNEDKPTKPEGFPSEMADVVIRILDFCGWAGIDLQAIMAEKHAYNLTREHRHGGKRV